MQSLFVLEQGARVVRRGERIVVMVKDATMEQVRADDLSQCVVMGNVSLTTPAVRSMLKSGVDVVFMTRGGRFIGRLSSGISRNILLRKRQFQTLETEETKLSLAASCVTGKIENQRRLLARYQKRRSHPIITQALVALRHASKSVPGAKNLDVLRGIEGNAAAAYFSCWPVLISAKGITFTRRMRRPPPDPVNILLSFGYTQLCNAIHSMVEAAGLDPYLGALHAPTYGRPSLVLDLVEEFRPVVVDTAVLRALNSGAIGHRDFQTVNAGLTATERELIDAEYGDNGEPLDVDRAALAHQPPVVFLKGGIKKWVLEYQRRMGELAYYAPRRQRLPMEQVISAQVHHFAKCVFEGQPYIPFVSPR